MYSGKEAKGDRLPGSPFDLDRLPNLPSSFQIAPFKRFETGAEPLLAAIERRIADRPADMASLGTSIMLTPAETDTGLYDPSQIDPEIGHLTRISLALAGSFDTTETRGWSVAEEIYFRVATIVTALQERIGELEGQQEISASAYSRLVGLSLGGEMVARMRAHKQKNLAKAAYEEPVDRSLKIREIIIARTTMLKIGGITLVDLAEFNPRRDLPAPYFNFLVQAYTADSPQHFGNIFSENQEPPQDQYPNLLGQAIAVLPSRIMGLTALERISFNTALASGEDPIFTQIEAQAQKLHDAVWIVIRSCHNLLLHPDASSKFDNLKKALEPYLSGRTENKLTALYMLGMHNPERIIHLYRKAQEFQRAGIESEFYASLKAAISEYIEEIPADGFSIPTIDDIVPIMASEEDSAQPVTSIRLLRSQVERIIAATQERVCDINPQEINWAALATPSIARVAFDPNHPRSFTIYLTFDNPEDEPIEFNWTVDTVSQTFDWSLIEDPATPVAENTKAASLRRQALLASQNILAKLAETIDDINVDQTDKSKRKRREGGNQLTTGPFVLATRLRENNAGKHHITLLPPDPEQFAGIAERDQATILEAIARFNEQPQFGRRRLLPLTDTNLFRLRIGDMRIIYERDGPNILRPLSVFNRREAYRRL